MDIYLIGKVVGRIFASYLIIWFLALLFTRFDTKKSFYHVHRWYGFIGLVAVFLLGIVSMLVNGGNV